MAGRNRHWRWDPNTELRLEDLVASHNSLTEIAAKLGIKESAIHKRMNRLHLDPKKHGYSVTAFCKLMDVSDKTAKGWIEREKWLSALPFGYTNRLRVIDEDEVVRFLEDPRTWVGWEPKQITDPILREHAEEVRGGVRYLSSGEAAAYLGYSDQGMTWNVRNKRLTAIWYHKSRWFQLAWLEDFVRRRDAGEFDHKRSAQMFSQAELDFLRHHRPRQPIGWLAAQMNRRYGTILGACRRLGLDGPRQYSRSNKAQETA